MRTGRTPFKTRPASIPLLHYRRDNHGIHILVDDLMNVQELKQAIYDNSLPASEASRLVDELITCPHFIEGCCAIEICENEPVLDYDSEPF